MKTNCPASAADCLWPVRGPSVIYCGRPRSGHCAAIRQTAGRSSNSLVPGEGIEPTLCCQNRILRRARLQFTQNQCVNDRSQL